MEYEAPILIEAVGWAASSLPTHEHEGCSDDWECKIRSTNRAGQS